MLKIQLFGAIMSGWGRVTENVPVGISDRAVA